LALRAVGLDQPLAVAGEIPQLADGRRRHEAAPQQPMLQQFRQPGRVADVGLAARQDLDVAGVNQHELEACLLQHIPDRLPVLAGGLQHHLGDALTGQPAGQRLQPRGEGRERPHLLGSAPAPVGHTDAGHHLVLGDVQPGAARVHQLHHRHLPMACGWRPAGPTDQATLITRAHSNSSWCREGPSVSGINGLSCTKESRARPGRPDSHPFVAAHGHGGLISNRGLSAVRTAVSPGYPRASGAKGCVVSPLTPKGPVGWAHWPPRPGRAPA
jgi:hypothetical protein